MIKSKNDLKEYLLKDKYALGEKKLRPSLFRNEIWKFEIVLRKDEYYKNTGSNKILGKYYSYKHHKLGIKLGLSIPCNVFEGGLRINHYGYIVVNPKAKVGEFCDIHQGVNIGENIDGGAPTLDDNVWIGPGAKIYGKIHVADEIMIGANAVVDKSFDTPSVTIAGVPAKIIKNQGNVYKRKLWLYKLKNFD